MPSIKKILFPVDFSERCTGAARYVESIAGWFEAEIMLFHVVDAATYDPIAQRIYALRREHVQTFLAEELKQFTTRRICAIGDPAEEIVKMARSWAPDLVMMPTYGLGFYRPSLLGSVTAKVLHDVDCPVWTGVHTEQAPPLEKITYFRVLCAVDFGRRSAKILEWADSLAREYGAELGIVHAAPLVEPPPGHQRNREFTASLEADARAQIGALQGTVGTSATVFIDGGEPAKVVNCAAREFNADLLVIGRHGGDDRYLRHNAYAIIRESPSPVVSI